MFLLILYIFFILIIYYNEKVYKRINASSLSRQVAQLRALAFTSREVGGARPPLPTMRKCKTCFHKLQK